MITGKLDHTTLDNLLIPAPTRTTSSLYNVTLVLGFLDAFLHAGGACDEPLRLKKVGKLIDLYLADVTPDPSLRLAKFSAVHQNSHEDKATIDLNSTLGNNDTRIQEDARFPG
ncbi:hypothetical protein E2562_026182 [Oryza meyeriana var. granulata]|uniref:NPH3 domain-containing protein n=1 Tax=Oryza meyeriana var. granulata TaxID=110450 RepID=A0A6G1E205_9ORYZ|nr:hypothetical protein E2562_026182 [Oryza meyeriana var. granulata]